MKRKTLHMEMEEQGIPSAQKQGRKEQDNEQTGLIYFF